MVQTLEILVVDDDSVDRMAVLRALRSPGLSVRATEVGTAATALAALAAQRFDCVFLDMRLPDRDGLEVLQQLRAAGHDMAVIVLTGHGDEETAVRLMRAGATDYLPKAVMTPERLLSSLRHALRVRRSEVALDRTARQQAVLAAASLAILQQLSEEALPAVLAGHARELLGSKTAETSLLPPGNRRSTSMANDAQPPRLTEGLLQPLVAPVLVSRAELAGSPLAAALNVAALPEREWLAAPLFDGAGNAIGVLHACDRATTDFDETDLSMLGQLARIGALGLENARLLRAVREASQARDEVVAVVSHDLRNPLDVVRMSTSLLLRMLPAGQEPARARPLVERIERATQQMARLVSDLLDASRIEAGALQVNPRPEDAVDLIQEAVESFRPLAAQHALQFGAEHDGLGALVAADRSRILQVFSNLLGNAFKFTPTGGKVTVRVERLEGRALFSVSDTGPGIAEEHVPRLFDRYWNPRRHASSGAGLGLYIAKGIIEAHGGRLTVETREGEGTTFKFSVPVVNGEPSRAVAS